MPRLRKLRRKQKFGYHINRKRLDKKLNKLPQINCDAIRAAWDDKKSSTHNLTAMGLVADPNAHKGMKIPSLKEQLRSSPPEDALDNDAEMTPEKVHVASALEKEARDGFQKKKETAHPLPPEMFKKLCKFIDKYGEDYEAMTKDHLNHYQETATQLRKQVERLKKIPQQWVPYVRSRGLITE